MDFPEGSQIDPSLIEIIESIPAGFPLMNITERQQKAANLVKSWSVAPFHDGRTLGDCLEINGWPLWPMVEVEFAVYHVGPSLTAWPDNRISLLRIKHQLARIRKVMRRRHEGGTDLARSGWPVRPAALFLGFSSYMLRDVLLPVIDELSKNTQSPPVVLYDGDTLPGSYNGNIRRVDLGPPLKCPQLPWQAFLDERAHARARGARRALIEASKMLLRSSRLMAIVSGEGGDYWPLLRWPCERLLRFRLPELLPLAAATENVLDHYPVGLLVSPDVADPRVRAFVLLAKARGIPTLEIQFGTYGPEAVEWRFFLADTLAVWGESPRRVMAAHGVPAERMVVTGSPRHDSLARPNPAAVAAMRGDLGAGANDRIVLFASTHTTDSLSNPTVVREMKEAVFHACVKMPGLRLAIKPHPLENVSETRSLAPSGADFIFLDPARDIRPYIAACDIFISTGSTATLDALILDKPVICLNFPGWETFSDLFARSGATLPAGNAAETRQALLALSAPGEECLMRKLQDGRRRFVEDWAYRVDGGSAARISKLALQLASMP